MSTFGMYVRCRPRLLCGLAFILLFAFPALLLSQAYFGTVAGLVIDPAGAVIPGVKITLTDVEKGYTFRATTNRAGEFILPSIPPSVYTVTAEMAGFDKAVRTGVKVEVASHVTVNMSLKLAGATQTVQVTSQNTSLQTQDATTGQVINKTFIEDLPLVDRQVMSLVNLAPGVTNVDDSCVGCGGTNFISNGSRNATADVLMDGASITNFEPNGGILVTTYTPSVEAVQEFKVQQTNFSAEYGFSGGSIVNMITQSGTNVFHGQVYDFVRNQVLDANSWFANYYGQPIPDLSRNQYGGDVGGPIFKNKTFFFFDWDGTRSVFQVTPQAGVPSAAERTGDFGEVCTFYGGTFDSTGMCSNPQGQIWDPYSGTYDPDLGGAVRSTFIPYNNIAVYASPGNPKLNGTPYQLSGAPGDLIDPIAQEMMNLFPSPNFQNGNIYDNWHASGSNLDVGNQYDIKIDQRFSQSNLLTGKYSHGWGYNINFNCFGNFADPCAGGPNVSPLNVFAIDDTQTFSPTLLLDVTFGFTRGVNKTFAYPPAGTKNPPSNPLSTLGFPQYLNSTGFVGVPDMSIGGGYYSAYSSASIGSQEYGNYKQGQNTGQLTVTLTKQLGTQELKFGFEGRQHQQNYIQTNAPYGTFAFDQGGSSQCPNAVANCGGDGMATFLMGYADGGGSYEIQDQPATENYQFTGYVQDNWRATNKLTVNLGLRYEVSLPRTDRFNRQNWFDPNVTSPLQVPGVGPSGGTGPLVGGEVFASPSQRKIVNTDWKDWQPRIGFAYQFSPKWVVRGGWGVYYSQSRSGATGVAPYGSQGFNQSTNMITTYQNDGATPYLHLSNPYPNGLILPPGNSLGLLNDVGFGAVGPLRNEKITPSEESWSLGIERQLMWNVLLDVEYIGKKGTNLYFGGDNQLNILPVEVENYSLDQIAAIQSYVNNPFQGYITNPNSVLSSPTVQQYQLDLPYPQFTSVTTDVPPVASSIYHSLQITSQKNFSNGLQFLLTYVWSKSIDDASAQDDNTVWLGSFISLQDPNKPYLERSLSSFDIPQVFQASYVYALPVGRGRQFLGASSRWVDAFLGGWTTNGIWRISAGRPLALTTYDGTQLPTYGPQRPDIIGTPHRNHGHGWINNFFTNPGVFVLPPLYAIGDISRTIGSVRTPYNFDADLSLMKIFSLEGARKGMSIEVRIEAQNAFNHPTFGTPNTSLDNPNFGMITYTSSSPRNVQLGARFRF